MKSEIIEQLGQANLLLPSLIADGLAANDRVKARLSVLQAAACHTRDPNGARFDLASECRTAGLDALAMEALVNRASPLPRERITAPGLGDLIKSIRDDVDTMVRAVRAGDAAQGELAAQRLSRIDTTAGSSDCVEVDKIGRLTGISENDGAGLHRLVMDLHKVLNRLSASHAEEVIAGAHVYGLLPQDRPAIEAFMKGVESTRALKFGHPGLATTAARSGARLTIQNDIGETDAHVVVIAIEDCAVTITYTDVHLARAKFFTALFRNFAVQWSGLDRKKVEGLGDDDVFYLITGRYATSDARHRDALLELIGASLVFLIDWNKARKLLRTWISKGDAVRVLDWAARQRIGHRAFLELGGDELVASAVHRAAPTRIGFNERLDRALGREAAVEFVKTVLRVSTQALAEGGSIRLARDQIEADLVRRLKRVDSALLAVVVRQAGLAREIAATIARFIDARRTGQPFVQATVATTARRIEEKADKITLEARSEIARFNAESNIEQLVNSVEEVIDELEQAAFIASLAPEDLAPDVLVHLGDLCSAAVNGAGAAAMGAATAADIPDGHRIDADDALAAIAQLIEIEHQADAAERAITAIVLRGDDFNTRTALAMLELGRAIERATDRLAGFGHLLRRHVLADLSIS